VNSRSRPALSDLQTTSGGNQRRDRDVSMNKLIAASSGVILKTATGNPGRGGLASKAISKFGAFRDGDNNGLVCTHGCCVSGF
jgi:hypothetical protein